MPTMEEYATQPVAQRLGRLERTAEELAAALRGHREAVLARRPDPKNWAPKEVACHLRDTEELFQQRFGLILANDEPKFVAMPPDTPDRWAEERQYLANDVQQALGAFRRRREETLALLRSFSPGQWQRAGIHHSRGRMAAEDILTLMAWHDDNHLDQLRRALQGKS